jgi:hypothetical protein
MSIRVEEAHNGQPIARGRHWPLAKIAAVLVWFGAVYTTYLALASLQAGTPWFITLGMAAATQFVLTVAERPILNGRPSWFTGGVLLIDALVNAGGIFPLLRNVGSTPTAQMAAAGGVAPDVGNIPAILLSLVFGLIIAAAPEALWRMKD